MPKGKHENHRRGSAHYRWSEGRIVSEHGYIRVRVGRSHPLADPNGYAYEHLMVWVSAGRPRPELGQVIHHKNEDKTDNRLENLELLSRTAHNLHHAGGRTDEQVREIRERYAAGERPADLCKAFGLSSSRLFRYLNGQTRRSAGGPLRKPAAGRLLDGRTWDEFPGEVRDA